MKKTLQVLLVIFLTYKFFTCSPNQKNNNSEEELMGVVHTLIEEGNESSSKILSKVKSRKSTTKVIKWYYIDAPIYKPSSIQIEINSISNLKRALKNSPEKIKALILSLDKTNEKDTSSINLDAFKNLEYLQINNSKYVPVYLNGLKKIKTLNFNYTYDLLKLPEGIGDLKNLEHLLLVGVNAIKEIPKEIFQLTNLKTLEITALGSYGDTIPPEIQNLNHLSYLNISSNLNIPQELGNLRNLKELHIANGNYETPYQNIYNLSTLEVLKINTSKKTDLNGISKLQNLEVLNLTTDNLNPEIALLSNLEGLILNNNKNSYPTEFEHLNEIRALQINRNNLITKAPNFIVHLENLDFLDIRNCSRLAEFDNVFKELKNVSYIQLLGNDSIKTLPNNLLHLKDRILLE